MEGAKGGARAENQAQTEPSPIQKAKALQLSSICPQNLITSPLSGCVVVGFATPRIQISARFCLVLSNALQPSGELEFESQFDTM